MRLLVLGGTRFLGRAVVADALDRGWDVTTLHRGLTGRTPAGAHELRVDRTSTPDLARALDGDPRAEGGEYPVLKRGAELGVLAAQPGALLARAGLLLGPHEDIGRLPWWLTRVAHGGRVVAPGRPDRPLQYVDARDAARWMLSALEQGVGGPVDVASRSGHATTGSLLGACGAATGSGAELVWVDEAALDAAGAQPWTQLPCWVPEVGDTAGFLEADTSRAAATGLVCRPVEDTVADTWRWLTEAGAPEPHAGRPRPGLPPEVEAALLAGR